VFENNVNHFIYITVSIQITTITTGKTGCIWFIY